jgi:hypothetical protein
MVHVIFWLQLLPLLLTLMQSDACGEDFSKCQNQKNTLIESTFKSLTELLQNENLVSQFYVICCYYDTAICYLVICCLFLVTRIQLHES